jgi:hypothetical protein
MPVSVIRKGIVAVAMPGHGDEMTQIPDCRPRASHWSQHPAAIGQRSRNPRRLGE